MQGTGFGAAQIRTAGKKRFWAGSLKLKAFAVKPRNLAVVLLLGTACAASRPDIIRVGPWFPARPASEVPVFFSREQTIKPWGAIAIIHSAKFPADARSALERQKKLARKMAAEIGADGIIISEERPRVEPRLGVYQEPEIFISALAFKYAANIPTAAK